MSECLLDRVPNLNTFIFNNSFRKNTTSSVYTYFYNVDMFMAGIIGERYYYCLELIIDFFQNGKAIHKSPFIFMAEYLFDSD